MALGVRTADEGSVAFEGGKPLALVAYLAVSSTRSATREDLLDLLWADLEPAAARHALRQTLWYLRRKLGDDVLAATGERMRLTAVVDSDQESFLGAIARDETESAIALYEGDFLVGFAAPGCAGFERWAAVERERLRGLFLRGATTVARRHLAAGRARAAQPLARRVRELDPFNQAAWRVLLEAHLAAGDSLGAAVEADAFERLASAEELEPEPATRTVLRAVRRAASDDARATNGSADEAESGQALVAELVGREREFATMLAQWERARAGHGGHAHLAALAGLGKSRLLTDVRTRLRAMHARVVRVRAAQATQDFPYALAGDLAAALATLPGARGVSTNSASVLVALDPRLSTLYAAAPDESRDEEALRRRALALRELVEAVSAEHALAILVDDLHWSDAASTRLLRALIEGLAQTHALVITAGRPSGGDASTDATVRLELAPLTVTDVSALVASLGALPNVASTARLPSALHASTGGSPFLVLETLRLLIERGLLVRSEAEWTVVDESGVFALLQAGSALRARISVVPDDEARLLLLLSFAGGPLASAFLVRAARHLAGKTPVDERAVATGCAALERRGLVMRHDDGWIVSHDEIGHTAADLASADARRAAEMALGRALADAVPVDVPLDGVRTARQAALHLARAGDEVALVALYARSVRAARRTGDRRALRALAHDLVGAAADDRLCARLVASLPLLERVWLPSAPQALAGALLVAVTATAAVAADMWLRRPAPAQPDAVLLAVSTTGADSLGTRVARLVGVAELRADRWSESGALIVDLEHPSAEHSDVTIPPSFDRAVPLPRGLGWTVVRRTPDGDDDVYTVSHDGASRRLTQSPGDDASATASPDGVRLAFTTQQGAPHQEHYDLAVMEPGRSPRRIETGDGHVVSPFWSPDGSAIAFHRRHFTGDALDDLCVAAMDGSTYRCRPASSTLPFEALVGWSASSDLVVVVRQDSAPVLARLGSLDAVPQSLGWIVDDTPRLSPGGDWLLCHCRRAEDRHADWIVFRTEQPSDARRVVTRGGDAEHVTFGWGPARRPARDIRTLAIELGPGAPSVGVPYQLRAIARDSLGLDVKPALLTWRLRDARDSALAMIDDDGVLRPQRAGRVTVVASAGGWQRISRTVVISSPIAQTLISESWTTEIDPGRWRGYGEPLPDTVTDRRLGHAMWNRGDSRDVSGLYSTRRFPTERGLGVDALVASTFTTAHWRLGALRLVDLDSAVLRGWNHRSGGMPAAVGRSRCTFGYPMGEGNATNDRAAFEAGESEIKYFSAPPAWRAGQPVRVRLQLFPDGRCGVAIDGRPVWISRSIDSSGWARLDLFGMSAGDARMLVGPLRVFAGVAMDINWDPMRQRH